jgi:hypothetical protein
MIIGVDGDARGKYSNPMTRVGCEVSCPLLEIGDGKLLEGVLF